MAERKSQKGAFLVIIGTEVHVESSEIKALRMAVATGGTVQYVEFGGSIDLGSDIVATETEPVIKDSSADEGEGF